MSSPLPRRCFPRRILASLVALSGLVAITGCPGSLEPGVTGVGGSSGGSGGGGGSNVCDAPTMVFASIDTQTGCGSNAGCHGATQKESGLDLVSPNVISRLLGKAPDPTTSVSCMASTEQYLIPNTNPAQGLLIDKLGTSNCGSPMPFPLGNLPAAQRDCLTQWAAAVTTGMITQ